MTILVKTGLCTTKSDARRNVQQGGVTVNDEKITDIAKSYTADELRNGLVVKRGKKNFNKLILK
jgi:tyrosyl-tRNA synthetase